VNNNKKLTVEDIFERNESWKDYNADAKKGKKPCITRAQFNKQWEKIHLKLK
jgi:hypothetical protein